MKACSCSDILQATCEFDSVPYWREKHPCQNCFSCVLTAIHFTSTNDLRDFLTDDLECLEHEFECKVQGIRPSNSISGQHILKVFLMGNPMSGTFPGLVELSNDVGGIGKVGACHIGVGRSPLSCLKVYNLGRSPCPLIVTIRDQGLY